MNNPLVDIISDIKKESCVLIVGPDIIDLGQKSFFETMCDEFFNDRQYKDLIDTIPPFVFTNEELLQLQPNAERTILRMMERFYQKQTAFEEPLKKISQMPFHLIISLLPDDRLSTIFKDQDLPSDYSYYPRETPAWPVEKPTQKKPLIYNLLGDFNSGDVIITFDHLFTFLSGIMGKRELPQNIQEALKKSRTFLFLGVHFEKWYTQLLLRIITSKDKYKYTILKERNDNDVSTFIARRLEVDFIPISPVEFLDELYTSCYDQNLLKITTKKSRAKVFISYSHLDKNVANYLEGVLKKNNIEIIVDENSMPGGQKIEDFIGIIRSVDIVIPIISENSLLSPWVSKEIMMTVVKGDKRMIPCCLDETFLDDNFIHNAERVVDEKISQLNERIKQRGRASSDDLFTEQKNWTEYYANLPVVINELKKRLYRPLKKDNLDADIDVILNDIYKLIPH